MTFLGRSPLGKRRHLPTRTLLGLLVEGVLNAFNAGRNQVSAGVRAVGPWVIDIHDNHQLIMATLHHLAHRGVQGFHMSCPN